MRQATLIDLSLFDVDKPIADINVIRQYNPQRHEMEQLSAILYEDLDDYCCAAVKELSEDEFWVRGHMLEAVAQLSSYFTQKHDLLGSEMVGFGGLDSVRFRGVVSPGDRLILLVKMVKTRRGRMIVADFQGVVGENVVLEGTLRGIPIPVSALTNRGE